MNILRYAAILAKITDVPGTVTRTYRSPAMRRANAQVAKWMRAAGLTVREDSAGNLIGRLVSKNPNAKTFILGSHLDTVRDAGKYDGILGVLTAIAVVKKLPALPFHLEVYAFADEEGVRYSTSYLGSGAVTGSLTSRDLKRKDADGVSLAGVFRNTAVPAVGCRRITAGTAALLKSCRRNPRDLLGYAEVHIEQGPVLDKRHLAIGVVKAIAGQTRARVTFTGQAGHAGTTPMKLRRDALAGAAEFVLAVERLARRTPGLVATVGMMNAHPGAGNVIPGRVECSLDVRHESDSTRTVACRRLSQAARQIAGRRKLAAALEYKAEASAAACDVRLMAIMRRAAQEQQPVVPLLVSGAGHDAAALAAITPVVMLFVRCKAGISHNPAESVRASDVAVAAATLRQFLECSDLSELCR